MKGPFDKYPGGKSGEGVYQTLINQIPPHDTYVEAFLGNGGVYRHKLPANNNILCDKDPEVIARWKVWVKTHQRQDITRLINKCFVAATEQDILSTVFGSTTTFLYCDPPYPIQSRKQQHRDLYHYEMTDDEHEQLLRWVVNPDIKCPIMLSTYPNPIYQNFLDQYGWRKVDHYVMTRWGRVLEWLIMNYPEPTELHDYRYLGADYREREAIVRQQRNMMAKLSRMPELRRNALLQLIAQKYTMPATTSINTERIDITDRHRK